MADPKTPAPAKPKAPGPDVVEALANGTASGAVAMAIVTARDALKREYDARDGGLTPPETWVLGILEAHSKQLVTATTVPSSATS
jgi:hypothetical protein